MNKIIILVMFLLSCSSDFLPDDIKIEKQEDFYLGLYKVNSYKISNEVLLNEIKDYPKPNRFWRDDFKKI